jgi:superfamily II DNA helicase RecQ
LAVLGGKKKVVIVICPLKALERDQVSQFKIFIAVWKY